jgi:hypothetical protein
MNSAWFKLPTFIVAIATAIGSIAYADSNNTVTAKRISMPSTYFDFHEDGSNPEFESRGFY